MWGKRPTQVLTRDEYFGSRDPLTGEPTGERDDWDEWDHALVSAYQTVEYYTDKNGIHRWKKEDPRLKGIDAVRKIDPYQESVDLIVDSPHYKKIPGAYFVPEIKTERPGDETWTYEEWVKSLKGESDKIE